MPLGSNIQAGFDATPVRGNLTISADLRTTWVVIRDAGDMDTVDAVTVDDPDADITNSTTHILTTGGRGTKLLLRMRYDDGDSSPTDPVVKVFGRHSSSDTQWMTLSNDTPAIVGTIVTTVATDVTDATNKWSTVLPATRFPLLGCDELLVGLQTAYAATGNAALALLEAKVI